VSTVSCRTSHAGQACSSELTVKIQQRRFQHHIHHPAQQSIVLLASKIVWSLTAIRRANGNQGVKLMRRTPSSLQRNRDFQRTGHSDDVNNVDQFNTYIASGASARMPDSFHDGWLSCIKGGFVRCRFLKPIR
jgi:hypothetical protein